ncbi:MAG: hypothetical protein JSS81_22670 [Acidobacteria bacterium]|nr:hypothetical protein [Acidobacteriota bacterium]
MIFERIEDIPQKEQQERNWGKKDGQKRPFRGIGQSPSAFDGADSQTRPGSPKL